MKFPVPALVDLQVALNPTLFLCALLVLFAEPCMRMIFAPDVCCGRYMTEHEDGDSRLQSSITVWVFAVLHSCMTGATALVLLVKINATNTNMNGIKNLNGFPTISQFLTVPYAKISFFYRILYFITVKYIKEIGKLHVQFPYLFYMLCICYQQMYCLLIDWLLSTHCIASAKTLAIESCLSLGQHLS